MAEVDIQLELNGGETVGDLLRFEPGSRLEGRVQVTPAEDIHCRRVAVQVSWHTADRGRDESGPSPVAEQHLADGPLPANALLSQPFAFDLPREPWSFTGTIVNIVWEVRVVIDLPLAADLDKVQPFILAPRDQGAAQPSESSAYSRKNN